jgi:hypothetical protein
VKAYICGKGFMIENLFYADGRARTNCYEAENWKIGGSVIKYPAETKRRRHKKIKKMTNRLNRINYYNGVSTKKAHCLYFSSIIK